MSVTLQKGDSVNLSKEAPNLAKLVAGAGWDAKAGRSIDLDLLTVYIGEDGKAIPDANGNGTNLDEAVCFFNNLTMPGARHTGDNLTGEGEGEQIELTLANIPSNVKEVAVVIASYSGEKFSEVENAFVRMVNADGNTELAKYELKEGMGDTKGVELGRVVRDGSEWKFNATGQNIAGDFKGIVASYGVNGL
jgi:tellurium resistance protein TerD